MSQDTQSPPPWQVTSQDLLTDLLRDGARALLAQALEAEVAEHLAQFAALRDDQGRRQVVRNGHRPERTILSGLGPIAVRSTKPRTAFFPWCSQGMNSKNAQVQNNAHIM